MKKFISIIYVCNMGSILELRGILYLTPLPFNVLHNHTLFLLKQNFEIFLNVNMKLHCFIKISLHFAILL